MFHIPRTARNDLLLGTSFICGLLFASIASSYGYLNFSSPEKQSRYANNQLYIKVPDQEFRISANEKSVWFAFEIVNGTSNNVRILGFETSCSCTNIKQQLPFDIPSHESRFITGEVDTDGLLNPIIIKSRIYADLGLTENTAFSISVSPEPDV